MKLSALQKFILIQSLLQGGKIERGVFRRFYGKLAKSAKEKYQESIITKSLEHLIDRELLVGYGKRTPHKWFLTHITLTKKGLKVALGLLEQRQTKLLFK